MRFLVRNRTETTIVLEPLCNGPGYPIIITTEDPVILELCKSGTEVELGITRSLTMLCDRTYNIHWSCSCLGKPGATPVWIKIGGNAQLSGCQWNDADGWHLCIPGPAAGQNGSPMFIIVPSPQGPPCSKLEGTLLMINNDAVFCQKGEGKEVPCPTTEITPAD